MSGDENWTPNFFSDHSILFLDTKCKIFLNHKRQCKGIICQAPVPQIVGSIPGEEGDFCGWWKSTDAASFGGMLKAVYAKLSICSLLQNPTQIMREWC